MASSNDTPSPTDMDPSEYEHQGQRLSGPHAWLVALVSIAWSLFQVAIATVWSIQSDFVRATHLGFALALTFLLFGWRKSAKTAGALRHSIRYALAGLAALSAAYYALDYNAITSRQGLPTTTDIVMCIALFVLLLEGCRRVVGPVLSLVAMAFMAYAFFGPYMPEFMAFKGVSVNRFVSQMTMSSEGIYGVPLDVSANVVFLFVLFGAMLERAGGGQFFIQLALSLLGGYRGGPAKAAVLGSGLTGMVNGSSIANIVTTGTFTIPLMKKVGYPAKKAAAIEVAASTDGQLAPPIMGAAAFIMAATIPFASYQDVIKAAAIPAFVSYTTLFFITHLEACKLGLKGIPKPDLPQFFATLKGGLHYLLPLGTLIYFLVIEQRSPQYSASLSVAVMAVVMLLQGFFIKSGSGSGSESEPKQDPAAILRQGFNDIGAAMISGARNMIAVALATAGAGIIVGVISLGLGGMINEIVTSLAGDSFWLLVTITALASLIIGMGLPTTATYIVMASLTAPVIVSVAGFQGIIVPLMAAHLFCFYFGILADDTPPVGLAAYAAAAIAKSPPIPTGVQAFLYDIRTAILPFMFIVNTDIILHEIESIPLALLIFVTTMLGNFAFASATQGYFVRKNRWWTMVLMLIATFMFMRPDYVAELANMDHAMRYWTCVIPAIMMLTVFFIQRRQPETS